MPRVVASKKRADREALKKALRDVCCRKLVLSELLPGWMAGVWKFNERKVADED
jgi:hypothetical protein